MNCRFYRDLDPDQATRAEGVHHYASFADLVALVEDGCRFCIMIREEGKSEGNGVLIDIQEDSRLRCHFNEPGPALVWE